LKVLAPTIALAGTLALVACGGAERQVPDDEATTAQAPAVSEGGPINRFEFSPSGVEPAADLPTAAELTLSGGCAAPSPLSIGFLRGSPIDDTYFHFSMESGSPVAQGYTGEVELTNLVWDNGVVVPANMPADSPIRGPARLQGTGTLTIESHTGRGMGGHMSGTVSGTVTDGDTGDDVTIEVSFDINLACVG
jgi:hypothetical protein